MTNGNSASAKSALFAHSAVGLEVARHLLEHHLQDLSCIVTVSRDEIAVLAESFGCPTHLASDLNASNIESLIGAVDYIFLAWWPQIVPGYVLGAAKFGVVNGHPSLLPYNRGKNYNFWTIVEGTPFGATLHFANEGIDSGDILFQTPIPKSWLDNGESLYDKAQDAVTRLFKERFVDIINHRYERKPQDLAAGGLRLGKELEPASEILLDQPYTARALLNKLRARTFRGKPACYFYDEGKKYEARVIISEVDQN